MAEAQARSWTLSLECSCIWPEYLSSSTTLWSVNLWGQLREKVLQAGHGGRSQRCGRWRLLADYIPHNCFPLEGRLSDTPPWLPPFVSSKIFNYSVEGSWSLEFPQFMSILFSNVLKIVCIYYTLYSFPFLPEGKLHIQSHTFNSKTLRLYQFNKWLKSETTQQK